MKHLIIIILSVSGLLMLSSCRQKDDGAEALLAEIQQYYDRGEYSEALVLIDSLRSAFPQSVDARKTALDIFQKASIAIAQQNIARADSALQSTEAEYESLNLTVAEHRKNLTATAAELQRLNSLRARRDSLRVAYETECAKVKYIHRRQNE